MNFCQAKTNAGRRGISATEFVISLPLLIALCLVAVDLGRFSYAAITLANAARVGAEAGACRGVTSDSFEAWKTEVKDRVFAELADLGGEADEEISTQVQVSSFDDQLPRVEVEVEYEFSTIVNWGMIPHKIPIRRSMSIARFR